jgi:hypothetical protein
VTGRIQGHELLIVLSALLEEVGWQVPPGCPILRECQARPDAIVSPMEVDHHNILAGSLGRCYHSSTFLLSTDAGSEIGMRSRDNMSS